MPSFFEIIRRTGNLTMKARYMGMPETYQGKTIRYGMVYEITLKLRPNKMSRLFTGIATGIRPSKLIFVTIRDIDEGWSVECPYSWQGLNEIWKPLVRIGSLPGSR